MRSFIIDEKTLKNLLEDHFKLTALENGGVDNWQGYDFAMEEFCCDVSEDDIMAYTEGEV